MKFESHSMSLVSAELIITGYSGPYPELQEAESLKRTDPEAALLIALPIAAKEKGMKAKFLCCQIYRLQKDYEAERRMIVRILNHMDSVNPEEILQEDLYHMKSQRPTILQRLNTVESRIASREKNKKKH